MEGILIVEEKRSVIDKFKDWYKEKLIETKKAENFEEKFTKAIDFTTKLESGKDKVGAVIIAFIPEVNFLAPLIPIISKVKTKMFELEKNMIIKAKRGFEAKFIGADGTNKNVVIPDMSLDQILTDVKTSGEDIKYVVEEIEKAGKTL